jgi:lysophospholipase L1-like esterase
MLKPKVVILSARWDYLGPDQGFASCAEKLSQTIQLVKAAGVQRVVVIGSAPFWTNTVPSVLIDDLRRHPHKPIPNRLPRKLLKSHDDALLRDTSQKAGAAFVPIFDFLCDDVSCIATTGPNWMDLVTYDSAHFTEHGSVLVAQRIWPTILQSLT